MRILNFYYQGFFAPSFDYDSFLQFDLNPDFVFRLKEIVHFSLLLRQILLSVALDSAYAMHHEHPYTH